MGKKSSSKKNPAQKKKKSETELPPMSGPGHMERMMTEFVRSLDEQKFADEDERDAFLENFLRPKPPYHLEPTTPAEAAQNLVFEAWDMDAPVPRVELAREALELWKDCAGAYVILGDEAAHTLIEAKHFYEQAVEAGARAIGPDAFESSVGAFWGILGTRPYMRARVALAGCLWTLGDCDAAIDHLFEMLRLNPSDNQGIRFVLCNWLLARNRDEELGLLLRQYSQDPTAVWAYSRALLAFRAEGRSRKAAARLKAALKVNPFVSDYLLGFEPAPDHVPEYIGFGDETEAIAYALDAAKVWLATEGALAWLRESLPVRTARD